MRAYGTQASMCAPPKLMLVGEENEGRCYCCAPPISIDVTPWMARPRHEDGARREGRRDGRRKRKA
jgi:hypothetical protein